MNWAVCPNSCATILTVGVVALANPALPPGKIATGLCQSATATTSEKLGNRIASSPSSRA